MIVKRTVAQQLGELAGRQAEKAVLQALQWVQVQALAPVPVQRAAAPVWAENESWATQHSLPAHQTREQVRVQALEPVPVPD